MTVSVRILTRRVTTHRSSMAGHYPTPPAKDSIEFAQQEAAELDDAWKRQEPAWKRNNAKQIDPQAEAADLGYMIFTAISEMDAGRIGTATRRDALLAHVHDRLAWAMINLETGHTNDARRELHGAAEAWITLCERSEWTPADLIAAACAKVEAKHKPPSALEPAPMPAPDAAAA